MSMTLRHHPVLGGKAALRLKDVTLEALPEGHVLQLLAAAPEAGPGLRERIGDSDLRPLAPGQWLLIGNAPLTPEDLTGLEERLKPVADIVDQSHGRVRIALSGPAARAVLAKGTAVDLDAAAFPVGHAAQTLIGHIGAHLARTGEDSFELTVLRGFAESLWDDLAQMAAEFA
ncbi:hypothetical protein BTR14_18255 [Rhizobium rhizosphaerae]|uniref:GCVT N-terminal domain-containing protein n=1 Tax=Xaviernesmea rhizosphaerae TaxID=1672749 RepID=A0ABX3P9S1_9HYPH|nr:sarcosine oxidase subunit gamma family protein [Xaviernesmea rhizosphaerae]OQP84800.1 hypothetical protein BTR14_18255 [Xaviernesmea rhizosphaerae]